MVEQTEGNRCAPGVTEPRIVNRATVPPTVSELGRRLGVLVGRILADEAIGTTSRDGARPRRPQKGSADR